MKPFFQSSLEIDGVAPFRAVDKLVRHGIFVYGVQKLSATRLKIVVKSKEMQKVFAIFRGSCYTVTKAKKESFSRLLGAIVRRPGIILGAVLFLILGVIGNAFVLKIDIVGSAAYRRDQAEEYLSAAGIRQFGWYDTSAADAAQSALLSLPGVVFATVEKKGPVLIVTLEEEEIAPTPSYEKNLLSPCAGEVEEVVVLRGTALVKVGDTVEAGQELVGGFYETESGERKETFAVARCTLIKTHSAEYFSAQESPEELRRAVAAACAEAGGEPVSSQTSVREEKGGYIYTVTLRVRISCAVNMG